MLFLDSKILRHHVDATARIRLFSALEETDHKPLIRSLRRRFFTDLPVNPDNEELMETSISSWTESTMDEPYITGDVFAFNDYLLYVIFDDDEPARPLINAGIVYETSTAEPFRKLDRFCHEVRDLLMLNSVDSGSAPNWETGNRDMPQGFRTFVEKQDTDSLYTSLRKETMSKRVLAASRLEDESARLFLRTARNAHQEGYAVKLLSGETRPENVPIERLEDVGLVERSSGDVVRLDMLCSVFEFRRCCGDRQ